MMLAWRYQRKMTYSQPLQSNQHIVATRNRNRIQELYVLEYHLFCSHWTRHPESNILGLKSPQSWQGTRRQYWRISRKSRLRQGRERHRLWVSRSASRGYWALDTWKAMEWYDQWHLKTKARDQRAISWRLWVFWKIETVVNEKAQTSLSICPIWCWALSWNDMMNWKFPGVIQ